MDFAITDHILKAVANLAKEAIAAMKREKVRDV